MEDEDKINHKMDEEITKVSSIRGKIKMDIEHFRKKVSRENANIIKQRVKQTLAVCDLEEKLKQEKYSRDKLQHDIIESQMQYEAISGKYEEELRLRADTLNKVNMNQKTCEVLAEYENFLGNTLKLYETEKAIFCKAFHDAAENVRNLTVKYQQEKEKHILIITDLQNQVAVAGEREQRDLQLFNEAQSINSYLQNEISELNQQLNKQAAEANNTLMHQDVEMKKNKEALKNQEMSLKTLSDQKISLEKEQNDLIQKINNLLANISDLKQQLRETNIIIENKKGDIEALQEDKQYWLKDINDKENLIASLQQNIKDLKNEISKMEPEHYVIISDLKQDIEENNTKYKADLGGLEIQIQDLNKMVEQLELGISNLRVSFENKEKELTELIEERAKQIEEKASANTELISELKVITDVRESLANKIRELESTIQEREKDIESKAACITDLMTEINKEVYARSMLENKSDQLKKEKDEALEQVKKLQNDLTEQEDVWSKKMTLAANTARTEKENLQAEIQDLQNTIENIRKDVVRDDYTDDNVDAVLPLSPVRLQIPNCHDVSKIATPTHKLVKSSVDSDLHGGNRNFSTLHDDSINSLELERRAPVFSRGENISPVTISAIKRKYEAAVKGSEAKLPRSPKGTHASQGKPRKFFKSKTTVLKY